MYLTFFKKPEGVVQTQRDYSINDVFSGVTYQEYAPPITNQMLETKTTITANPPSSYNAERNRDILTKLQQLTQGFNPATISNEYETFYIPKKSGGLREINAPKEELMNALREMKDIFQYELHVLYHNSAYAYVQNRNSLKALQVHQRNNSRWFLKLDIKDFFPNCTQEFVVKSLKKIYPFALWTEQELNSFLWICFRNDSLPQGTPMSPMLTNLIMIPIDYALQDYAQDNQLVYTRYADDILISSYNKWEYNITINAVNTAFRTLETPFKIKDEKTRFGSSSGRNWNLGLMYNKDNKITVGYKNKKRYKAMLNNLMIAEASANFWERDEIYHFQGITSYYLSIEPDYFGPLIRKYEQMYNLTLKEIYKKVL